MRELIDRQAAIDAVTQYAKFLWETYHETCNISGMIDAIDGVPTASPWHRVEEGLPKDNTWCVFISWNKHNFEQYRWIGTYSKEWGFQDDDNFMVDNVKYWMPLPEPPQEDA